MEWSPWGWTDGIIFWYLMSHQSWVLKGAQSSPGQHWASSHLFLASNEGNSSSYVLGVAVFTV